MADLSSMFSREASDRLWPRASSVMVSSWWPYWRTFAVTLVFLAAAQIVAIARGDSVSASFVDYLMIFANFGPWLFFAWLVVHFLRMMTVTRPPSPARAFAADLRDLLFSAERWRTGLPFLTVIFLLNLSYTYFKSSIPALNPFSWDASFAALDAALHGGYQPWELLQPVLGHPLVTFLVNFVYNLWYFVMIAAWLWLGMSRLPQTPRQRYLMAFVLTWGIGGGLLAIVFSSAGPCYFGRIVTDQPDVFAPLMDYLRSVNAMGYPIWALPTQEMLWSGYVSDSAPVSGISAMPSMHVATAALLVPAAWRMGRAYGYLALGFCIAIVVGSVHLGWHYAVDSYFGIVIAAAAWFAAGKLLGPWDDGAARQAPETVPTRGFD